MSSELTFAQSAQALTKDDIAYAETAIGHLLPAEFIDHYAQYNGGLPSKPYVFNPEIEDFIKISLFSPLIDKRPNTDEDTIEETYLNFKQRDIILQNTCLLRTTGAATYSA